MKDFESLTVINFEYYEFNPDCFKCLKMINS